MHIIQYTGVGAGDGAREAKAQHELRLARGVKVNWSFYTWIGIKSLNKGNVGPLLNGVSDLVTGDTDKAQFLPCFSLYQQGVTGCYSWKWCSGRRKTSSG